MVVDNKPGAGGNLGSDLTAKAPADGYTILLAANSHVTNGALYDKLPYDPIRDFTPISMVAYYALVLVTNLDLPVRNLRELVDYARAHPGKLSFGSAGTGTPTHLAAELFRGVAGIDLVHVPYKGAAPATADLLGGSLQGMFNNPVCRRWLNRAIRDSRLVPGSPCSGRLVSRARSLAGFLPIWAECSICQRCASAWRRRALRRCRARPINWGRPCVPISKNGRASSAEYSARLSGAV